MPKSNQARTRRVLDSQTAAHFARGLFAALGGRRITIFVLINGAFGVGKTTVSRELRQLLPGAATFDPEWLGFLVRRLPGYRSSDYQHLKVWRLLTILGARAVGCFRTVVLVPMTFSEPAYLREVRSGLASSRRTVIHFCLTAPIQVIRERLAARGEPLHDDKFAWVHRRSEECCAVHHMTTFSIQVATEDRSPEAIALDLVDQLQCQLPPNK